MTPAAASDTFDAPARLDRLGLGTSWVRTDLSELAFGVLDAWRSAGGRLIDTAASYGDGESEGVVGDWLRARGARDEVVLLTKAGHPSDDYRVSRVSPDVIEADLASSLERLGVPWVDILLLHRDDTSLAVGPLLEALAAQVRAGRARSYGVSNWTVSRLDAALAYIDEHGLPPLEWSSSYLGLAAPVGEAWPGVVAATDHESRAWYAAHAPRLVSWSPVANGFFRAGADLDQERFAAYLSPDNLARRDRTAALAVRHGVTTTQVALAWVLCQPFAPLASIGTSSPAHLAEAIAATALRLTDAELRWLEIGDGAGAWTP